MWGQIAGAVVGGLLSNSGASSANQAAAAQSRQQMDFQERMSNTSYQRGMKDMRKAGLNPILAYKQGGASTPSGSAAPVQNTLSGAAGEASALAQNVANIRLTNAQTDLATQQARSAQKDAAFKGPPADLANKAYDAFLNWWNRSEKTSAKQKPPSRKKAESHPQFARHLAELSRHYTSRYSSPRGTVINVPVPNK